MQKNLLASLRKYRPREHHDPLENFITEAFCWILDNHPDFSSFFLEKIMSNPGMHLPGFDSTTGAWETQYNFGEYFPDMVYLSNNKIIIFEHKAWSKLHHNQIQNYRGFADKNFDDNKIVLITASKYQHEQDPDLALCWSDIYLWVSEWIDKHPGVSFIFEDFIHLLKSEGMGPPAPISYESILYYYASEGIRNNISKLIVQVKNREWHKKIKQDYKMCVEKKRGKVSGEAWGRIGLHLLELWRPGIFIGFLLDGKDHCTKPINKYKGPDFCLIIDFSEDLHSQYPYDPDYIEMIKKLEIDVGKLGDGWELYDHLNDPDARTKNKWHPVHIRKPMLDIFKGTTTVEEQADQFCENADKLLDIIDMNPFFWKLRNKYSAMPKKLTGSNGCEH